MKKVLAFAICSLSSIAFSYAPRVEELKQEIRKIASENIGNVGAISETRAKLQPLADELGQYHSPASAADDIQLLEGAWKQVFSDDREPQPPGFKTDLDTVYQVITKDGYFYNLCDLKGFITVSGILRGEYKPVGDFLNIEFTKVSVKLGGLSETAELNSFVRDIEAGRVKTIVPPGSNQAPKGPVGARGNIRNIYIDEDFRVATGQNFADGKVDLYVLDKVNFPTRYISKSK